MVARDPAPGASPPKRGALRTWTAILLVLVAAVLAAGGLPVSVEYRGPSEAPLAEALQQARECDVLIVLLGYRYGWVPDGAGAETNA